MSFQLSAVSLSGIGEILLVIGTYCGADSVISDFRFPIPDQAIWNRESEIENRYN